MAALPPRRGEHCGRARDSLTADSRAALTVWAVVVPQSLAYATLAGVPSVHGLNAAVGALAAYAVYGTCRDLNMGRSRRSHSWWRRVWHRSLPIPTR
jgi:MFS superfamily sulfate permease-like transporter